MKLKPFRILITDNVVVNAGDAAILLAMQASFNATFGPHTQVECIYWGPPPVYDTYRRLYPELQLLPTISNAAVNYPVPAWNLPARFIRKSACWRLLQAARASREGRRYPFLLPAERRLLSAFEKADLVVVTGGASLSTCWTLPHARAERICQYEIARVLGKPLAFYAMSIGPFAAEDPLPDMLRPYLEEAIAVLCRDDAAMQVVRQRIQVTTPNVHRTIDEALLLEPRVPSRALVPPRKRARRIGVCVHQWHWLGDADPDARQRDFEARMARVCQALLEEGDTDLIFITTHQGVEGIHRDDAVSARIQAQLPEHLRSQAHVTQDFVHPQEFAHIMGECDLVISSRLHGAIMSLVGGTPVVALAYEPKTRGLMRQLDLEDCVLEMGAASTEEILALACNLLKDPPATRHRFATAAQKGRTLAQRNCQILKEALARRGGLQCVVLQCQRTAKGLSGSVVTSAGTSFLSLP